MSDPEIIFSTINRDSWHRRETGKGRKKKPKQNHNRNINSAENGESSCLPSSRTTNFPGNSRNKRKKKKYTGGWETKRQTEKAEKASKYFDLVNIELKMNAKPPVSPPPRPLIVSTMVLALFMAKKYLKKKEN